MKKRIAGLLCLVFLLLNVSVPLFALEHGGHSCQGENCSVCVQLGQLGFALQKLKDMAAGVVAVLAVVTLCWAAVSCMQLGQRFSTPISLRVQMNN